ncbi:uncharacterized protein [Macrobrachium rosenbergii]|uniref:uncharacterized protein n=1 Tax=Macrobrachium rosenbergii TaxID=79674 RepID=UPI0034D60EDA
MERALRPERLDILPTSPDAARVFKHWLFIFSRYKNATEGTNDVYLGMLANALSPENFELISDCSTYDDAIAKLNKVFIQPANEIVSRHRLATRRQMSGETIDEYLRALHKLSVDCNFKDVSSEVYRDESIRDAFIAGISSQHIRTRLLENKMLTLSAAADQARALELAFKDSQSYGIPSDECIPAAAVKTRPEYDDHICEKADRSDAPDDDLVALTLQEKCFFCGYRRHPRKKCPAKEVNCRKCNKLGHFAKVCLRTISMAASHYVSPISGSCNVDIVVNGREYSSVKFLVLPGLCADVILGIPFLNKHSSVTVSYGGTRPKLELSALATLSITPPRVFRNLSPDCHPIAVKSRRYSASDAEFIGTEIDRLLEEGVIEHSTSPWRAQVVVVHNRNKRRMVVDYSETINKFTYLDAYPLPNIDDLVNEIAKYKVFSSVDLKSAYHLVPLPEEDRPYTAFEADSGLYQFTRSGSFSEDY